MNSSYIKRLKYKKSRSKLCLTDLNLQRMGLTTERFTSSQEPLWLMLTGVVAVVVAELLLLSIDLKMF